jgi:hypothetical protein
MLSLACNVAMTTIIINYTRGDKHCAAAQDIQKISIEHFIKVLQKFYKTFMKL